METLRHLWALIWSPWSSLSQGARDNVVGTIIGGLFITLLTACLVFFRKSIGAGLHRFFQKTNMSPVPPEIPHSQEVIIKIEQPPLIAPPVQLPESTESAVISVVIPRPPKVGFVSRRDSEGHDIVERLKEELAPQKNQLLVLSGPGGVGKTTLAAEAARMVTGAHGLSVVWISADGRQDFAFATLLNDIATQIGHADLRALGLDEKTEQLQALMAATPLLVVLDNCETIGANEQTACVEFLLRRAHCPALITTRLTIPDARNITIPVMSDEEADTLLDLLIEQADSASISAQLDRERIKLLSERNALLMQWVMAQIIYFAQEPTTVLDELTHGGGDAADRVFGRSFNLVGDDGRAVLLALSLFAPDASRKALAQVAGFGEDLKRLNEAVKRLAGLWLVKTASAGSRLVVGGLTRELIKARLDVAAEANEYRGRYIAYFAEYAKAHHQSTGEDYDSLEAEIANLVSAAELAYSIGDYDRAKSIVYIVASPEFGVLAVHGYWDDATRLNERALDEARRLKSDYDTAAFAHNLAVMRASQGEVAEARRLHEESLKILKGLKNQSGIAISLHQLAMLAQGQGELAKARRLYEESLEIEKRLGNQSGIASSLLQLANLAQDQGELAEARRLYEESLEIAKRLGHQSGIAMCLHNLATLAQNHGELQEARRLYEESLEIAKRLGDQSGIADTLHELATLAQDQGESAEARRLYEESLVIKKRLGHQHGIAISLHNLAALAGGAGDNEEAARLFTEALEIFEKLKSPRAETARRSLERVKGKSSA